MADALHRLLKVIKENDGINDKARLASVVATAFHLIKDRSVYYCSDYAVTVQLVG